MTLLYYVDASHDEQHFLYMGLLVDGTDARAISDSLDQLVREVSWDLGCPHTAELHAHPMAHQKGEWAHASLEGIADLWRRCFELLDERVEIIGRGTVMASFAKRYDGRPEVLEFKNLLERVNERLCARSEMGFVVADEDNQHRELIQHDVHHYRHHSTAGYRGQKFTQFVDTAHFVDSRLSRLIQLADLVAYMRRRRISVPREEDSRREALMRELDARIEAVIPSPTWQYFTVRR